MSGFLTDLFQSIFTPGATPTLLVATNVTFACLQGLLLLLLIATYSIHFVALSFISAGLWWAINWFVMELQASQALEGEKPRQQEAAAGDDTDTEVETVVSSKSVKSGSKGVEVAERRGELKDRRDESMTSSKSEISTEDEWEKVSENEKDK